LEREKQNKEAIGRMTTTAEVNLLDQQIAQYVKWGWRVESRTDHQAVIVKGHRPNHILHLILTIITLGMWAIVWILLSIFGGEKRKTLTA
jgi:hypothetical protein